MEWGLRALALECMSVCRVAAALGISWHTANNAILTRAEQILNEVPDRFKRVEVLGVDDSPRASLSCGRYPLCVAPHQAGRPVCHRHYRPDPRA